MFSERSAWPQADTTFPVVLVGGEGDAALLAGGRVAAPVGWGDDLTAAIGAAGAGVVIVADADRAGEAALAAALPGLGEIAATWPLVVMFGGERLELVAGALVATDAQLLCDATLTEQVAAIALAGHRTHDGIVREGEAVRLRRLSEEVARIAGVLSRLAAGEEAGDVADRRPLYAAGLAEREVAVDAQAVRQIIRARRLRDGIFGTGLFEDPAWDMLLDLFAAELEGARVSVSSLCIAAAVAPTTALRWVNRLTDAGLFERRPDPRDRRRAFMALSARGLAAMHGYAAALARAGMGLA